MKSTVPQPHRHGLCQSGSKSYQPYHECARLPVAQRSVARLPGCQYPHGTPLSSPLCDHINRHAAFKSRWLILSSTSVMFRQYVTRGNCICSRRNSTSNTTTGRALPTCALIVDCWATDVQTYVFGSIGSKTSFRVV